ncbi:MAG: FAD-dependent oxidoreductase, partial [Armatimonadota bacterium]
MKVRFPSEHEQFHFDSWDEIEEKLQELGLSLPYSDNTAVLAEPTTAGPLHLPNALGIHPVEGCDGSADGKPEALTYRRYRRFAAGGSGLIWLEATAVVHEGRANPRQLLLKEENMEDFRRLRECITEAATEEYEDHQPAVVAQLTHSGRESKPTGTPEPIIAYHHPTLDPRHDITDEYPLITDDELDELQEAYVDAARVAYEAGFDAVDVKACHGYLLYELLNAFTREDSRYGGSYENRTRMVREIVQKIRRDVPDIAITSRLSVYDAMPYPYGFGMARDGSMEPDLTEPVRLIKELQEMGVCLINVAYGSPYYNPHVERPYDTHEIGGYVPDEHPLTNIATMVKLHRDLAREVPDMPLMGTGFTWLREFSPYVGAALVENNEAHCIGYGRQALAYPDFAREIVQRGELTPTKLCICCSSCTQIMRDGGRSGCVVRDYEVYEPIFKAGQMRNQVVMREIAKVCRDCHAPTCQTGCPAGVDIPRFVTAIADGDEELAYRVLRERNPLPEMCAYVCPAETLCEGECVQQHLSDGPVPIRQLQRYVCEYAREQGWATLDVPEEAKDERVAVIGAGPAGASCAIRLLQKGYRVTIIDAADTPGGIAAETIPGERLERQAPETELAAILEGCTSDRLQWRLNTRMGEDLTVDDLLDGGYDAVFVGVGMTDAVALPGADRPKFGVQDALGFLKQAKSEADFDLSGAVAVLGGGNTAMDAAITARRAGADDVYIVYRRSFVEMPAWPEERDEALSAGVHFLILTQPLDYATDSTGNLTGLKVASTTLGEPDESGRRRPEVDPSTERVMDVDLVIEAIGQRPPSDLNEWLPGIE